MSEHAGHAGHAHQADQVRGAEFWDERYRSADRIWSGNPNPQLVAEVADREPGRALDAGCGEGADAIWLAARGWTVVAADISAVALDRAAKHASETDPAAAARITWGRRTCWSKRLRPARSTWSRRSSFTCRQSLGPG